MRSFKEGRTTEYRGYHTVSLPEDEVGEFYQKLPDNPTGCFVNQYLVLTTEDGTLIEAFRWTGEKMQKVAFKTINSRFSGRVKPRNIQQQLALDMLYNDDVTVKMLTGKYGTGKLFAPLRSNAH